MRRILLSSSLLGLALVGCGGGSGSSSSVPSECVENGELEIATDLYPQFADGTFTPTETINSRQPVLPGTDVYSLDTDEVIAKAKEATFAGYRVLLTNFETDPDELPFALSTPMLPDEESLYISFLLYPMSAKPFAAGDTVQIYADTDYASEMVTPQSALTLYIESNVEDAYVGGYTDDYEGQATILYVDDSTLCVDWEFEVPMLAPDGSTDKRLSISGVTSGPVRETNPEDLLG
jgi:hypothetical protein